MTDVQGAAPVPRPARPLGQRSWMTDVWVLPDLDVFFAELAAALGRRLEDLAGPALAWMDSNGHHGEIVADEPLMTAVFEIAAAADPIVGSRQLSARAATLMAGLVGVVAHTVTGGMPLLWRDAEIPAGAMALCGDELLGLTVPDGSRSFKVIPTVAPNRLENMVEQVGWSTLTNLMAVCEWVDHGSGAGGMILSARQAF